MPTASRLFLGAPNFGIGDQWYWYARQRQVFSNSEAGRWVWFQYGHYSMKNKFSDRGVMTYGGTGWHFACLNPGQNDGLMEYPVARAFYILPAGQRCSFRYSHLP